MALDRPRDTPWMPAPPCTTDSDYIYLMRPKRFDSEMRSVYGSWQEARKRDGPDESEQCRGWVEFKRLMLSKDLMLEECFILTLNMFNQVVAA